MFFYILGSGAALPGNIDLVNCFEDGHNGFYRYETSEPNISQAQSGRDPDWDLDILDQGVVMHFQPSILGQISDPYSIFTLAGVQCRPVHRQDSHLGTAETVVRAETRRPYRT